MACAPLLSRMPPGSPASWLRRSLAFALIRRGVRVLTASGDDLTDSTDPSRKMMRQIAGSFAEYEKARLVGKLHALPLASGIRVVAASEAQEAAGAFVPSPGSELDRKVPPHVRKPLPRNDQWKAPTPDLEGHRKRLPEALGNTLSDEFVDVILGKLVEALRPGLYDQLEEATLNAALAIIDSMQPRSELQALLAVEIIATGFAGLRFLRQSHRNMTEDFINVYGNYAIKLLRLQNDMIQTFDRYQRGNKQTVEVRHVHIHPGGQGVVGIINPPDDRDAGVRE